MRFFDFGEILSSDSLPIRVVAEYLNCTVSTLQKVASNGLITITPFENKSYIRKTDLDDFQKHYATISEVAKSLNYPAQSVVKVCRDNDLKMAQSPDRINLIPYVMYRSEVEKLKLLVRHQAIPN